MAVVIKQMIKSKWVPSWLHELVKCAPFVTLNYHESAVPGITSEQQHVTSFKTSHWSTSLRVVMYMGQPGRRLSWPRTWCVSITASITVACCVLTLPTWSDNVSVKTPNINVCYTNNPPARIKTRGYLQLAVSMYVCGLDCLWSHPFCRNLHLNLSEAALVSTKLYPQGIPDWGF